MKGDVVLIGCGFVADLYMRSFQTFPGIRILGAYDHAPARLQRFCDYWDLPRFASLSDCLAALPQGGVALNLTNPSAHFVVNKAILDAGHHCYSEKPLALEMTEAKVLYDLAQARGLMLSSAPCSVLGEAAQTLAQAVRDKVAGPVRLIYAELDDGFIPQAPLEDWKSESGAPWPFEDEFQVGCTLEHAGYYLSWLIAMFGTVRRVVAASAEVLPDKRGVADTAPDFSVATLFFEAGPVVRLTCSIAAPHDHQIRVVGDKGVLVVKQAWHNGAAVRFHRRFRLRRRLIDSPLGRRQRLREVTPPKVGRRGAASMNFALGVAEMLAALVDDRGCRLSNEFALHLNEVTLAIQNAGETSGACTMTSRCPPMATVGWPA
ncbi:Gfo/Idh/MocA family oxidoreductase [Thalassobius sp. Cn5-15]|nr:Gfo/Idh/MocA family oxidoreductase [Thalassobius sp. Cn5-15]